MDFEKLSRKEERRRSRKINQARKRMERTEKIENGLVTVWEWFKSPWGALVFFVVNMAVLFTVAVAFGP